MPDPVAWKRRWYSLPYPRGSETSSTLSMIRGFLDTRFSGSTRFEGLDVMSDPDAAAGMSSRPIVHLGLPGVDGPFGGGGHLGADPLDGEGCRPIVPKPGDAPGAIAAVAGIRFLINNVFI